MLKTRGFDEWGMNVDKFLIINLKGNRLLGNPRLTYEDNINMDLDVAEHEHDTYYLL
jgi:hypothetical protein